MKKSTLTALLLLFSVVWLAAQQPVTVSNVPHVICDSGCSGTTLGQATMANSLPVAIASNQSAVPVSGTVAVTNASLDVALSTLATATKQDTGNTSLASIKTNTDPLVTSTAGGYVRQDSTGTIAKETGGNLDAILRQLVAQLNYMRTAQLRGSFGQPVTSSGGALDVNLRYPAPLDPCNTPNRFNAAISQTASTIIVSGRKGWRTALCSEQLVVGAAEIISWWEGTGSACGTGTTAVAGSTTAANGMSFAANGGLTSAGTGMIATTNVTGNDLCLAQSGSNRVAGGITYAYY